MPPQCKAYTDMVALRNLHIPRSAPLSLSLSSQAVSPSFSSRSPPLSFPLSSAHICCDSDFDVGGWDAYGEHWRFFYDCMMAPVAKQVGPAPGQASAITM